MITASTICKRFGAIQALADVDFHVEDGEIVGLAGENGSGKSTLARILSGALRPDSGTVCIDDRPVQFARPRDALEVGIAVVSQDVMAMPALSVAENVRLPLKKGMFTPHRRSHGVREVQPLLDEVGLHVDPSTPFGSLQPGDAVLAEIAKALVVKPRLLILDEVTTRLGGPDADHLFTLLRSLRSRGIAVVLITHRLAEIRALADRTVVLRDGKLVGELAGAEATEEAVSAMMVGRELESFRSPQSCVTDTCRLEVQDLGVPGLASPVSLSVHAGEVVGLCGLMGSGRTETLETITGARRALSGRVLVDGHIVRPGSIPASRAAGVAFVPEDRRAQGLLMRASVRMNFALGRWRAAGIARRSGETSLTLSSAERFGIKMANCEVLVSTLSGGNQQKVVIGRELARGPRVLLLDEPTRGVDIGARGEIFTLIGELLESGTAVLLASSDLRELLALSHRILVLHDRAVVAEVVAQDASEERLAVLMGGGS